VVVRIADKSRFLKGVVAVFELADLSFFGTTEREIIPEKNAYVQAGEAFRRSGETVQRGVKRHRNAQLYTASIP
jgi:hypothetical protein